MPDVATPGRLAIHAELPLARANSGRTALLLPAGGAAETDPGGGRAGVLRAGSDAILR